MREIKFEYVFKHVDTGRVIREQYDIVRIEVLARDDIHYHADKGYKLVSRRQFTGLHDKNGAEIYENDIIKWCGDKLLVKWLVDGWYAKDDVVYTSACDLGQEWEGDCVVIGNIHENPELLDD